MPGKKADVFEIVLLVVGIGASFLGFQFINKVFDLEKGQLSWPMLIAIFGWLTLLVLFILLSLIVDNSKKELEQMKILIEILAEKKKKK